MYPNASEKETVHFTGIEGVTVNVLNDLKSIEDSHTQVNKTTFIS